MTPNFLNREAAQEREVLRACIPALRMALRTTRRRLSQLPPPELPPRPEAPPEPEPPVNFAQIRLLKNARSASGLIIPQGTAGRILAAYEEDGETGWLAQFGTGLIGRVPAHLAEPVTEGRVTP